MITKNDICRKLAAEGTVLLKNQGDLLPLKRGTRVAVFGRTQDFYYRCGTGSGGGVFVKEVPRIIESLRRNDDLIIDETLSAIYSEWIKENPFDDGGGVWAGEPWFQKEMPLTQEIVENASRQNDVALVIIGRTAGEDHDNADVEGSYRLTADEEEMLSLVCGNFEKVVVALNVGNVIDLSFLDKYKIDSTMYIWHGGVEGANAFSDILSGRLYPSGKLSDTQVYDLSRHPTISTFGETQKIVYVEDVYVGYRYFETFAKENVRYPFGYGLAYTKFETSFNTTLEDGKVKTEVLVKNVGSHKGKHVIQVYYQAPNGPLGNPIRQLAQFAKTKELLPNEEQSLTITFPINQMASFDDDGSTGNKSCMVLLKGDYKIFVGDNVRDADYAFTYTNPEIQVVEVLSDAMAPYQNFDVIKSCGDGDTRMLTCRKIEAKETDVAKFKVTDSFKEITYTGDKGIKLVDVSNGKNTLEEFIAQLSETELASLVCGEGMSSPKATPGTAGALGGQTEKLSNFGIPVCCVADGPSGIKASPDIETTLTPNGTMIACSWNLPLVKELFTEIGVELKQYGIDSLLGPGLNIHRIPLCGRNFEYFSEDPYLTGKMGAAVTLGIAENGGYATIKHFCCNNQEKARAEYDATVSQRALREIYLKPFEITVKEGQNVLIMTSYNSINGFWAASNYDLTTSVLRDDWKFENFVMTDWWAKCNKTQGSWGSKDFLDMMVRSQNDLYMVCEDSQVKSNSILNGIRDGTITVAELQLCCKNILKWITKTNTFKEYVKSGCVPKYPIAVSTDNLSVVDTLSSPKSDTVYPINARSGRNTAFVFELSSELDGLAQIPITVKVDNSEFTFTVSADEKKITRFMKLDWLNNNHKISISYSNAISVNSIFIKQKT